MMDQTTNDLFTKYFDDKESDIAIWAKMTIKV
jgi:hypothetical protein